MEPPHARGPMIGKLDSVGVMLELTPRVDGKIKKQLRRVSKDFNRHVNAVTTQLTWKPSRDVVDSLPVNLLRKLPQLEVLSLARMRNLSSIEHLPALTALTSLDLSGTAVDLGSSGARAALGRLKLRELRLDNVELTDNGLSTLEAQPQLQVLSLSRRRRHQNADVSFARLADVLRTMTAMTTLHLDGLQSDAEYQLVSALEGMAELQSLSCAGVSSLVSIVGLPASVTSLDLSNTAIDLSLPEESAALGRLRLLKLDLEDVQKSDSDDWMLGLETQTRLQELALSENDGWETSVDLLAPVLAVMTDMRKLNLGGLLGGNECVPLGGAISRMSALTELILWVSVQDFEGIGVEESFGEPPPAGHQPTTAAAIEAVAAGLVDSGAALEGLSLGYSMMGAQAAAALSGALQRMPETLRYLRLEAAWMMAEGAVAFAPALACLKLLVELDLSSNWIGHVGAEALSSGIAGLTRLERLSLAANAIDGRAAAALVPALAALSSLQKLVLGDDGMRETCWVLFNVITQLPALELLVIGTPRNELMSEEAKEFWRSRMVAGSQLYDYDGIDFPIRLDDLP